MSKECFAIYTIKNLDEKYITDLSTFNFFTRNRIKEFILATAKEVNDRTAIDNIIDLQMEFNSVFYVVGVKINIGTCIIFTTDANAHKYLVTLSRYILIKGLADTIGENFDYIKSETKMKNIIEQLDDVKFIMIDNIEQLKKREETLDDLVKKSEYLSNESKIFYVRAKKLNRCCAIL